MATPLIEKIPHRKVGDGKDHKKIELSWQQLTPGDAKPEDFVPISEELEFGGACGDTPEEYERDTCGGRMNGKTGQLTITRLIGKWASTRCRVQTSFFECCLSR